MAYTNIDDPSAYFQTAIYTGSNNQSITNDGNSDLQPDFVWIKRRSNADHHSLTILLQVLINSFFQAHLMQNKVELTKYNLLIQMGLL